MLLRIQLVEEFKECVGITYVSIFVEASFKAMRDQLEKEILIVVRLVTTSPCLMREKLT